MDWQTEGLPSNLVKLKLASDFRYLHEPIASTPGTTLVGREPEVIAFSNRILHSSGGSFLITGYRGVGKTSFVNRSLAHIEQELEQRSTPADKHSLVHVALNLAKPMQPVELMFHVIRCLYAKLSDLSIMGLLSNTLREQIDLAHRRTAMTVFRSAEHSREVSASLSDFQIPVMSAFGGSIKSSLGYATNHKSNQQHTYLAYDERAAEFDLIRLARFLSSPIPMR